MYHRTAKLLPHFKRTSYGLQRYLSVTQTDHQKDLPSRSEIVIAGAGAIGSSIAYHLTKCGWKDVLLIEQGMLKGGQNLF